MHNILMILRREYLERATKKSFWLGTAVFPVLIVGLSFVPMLLVNAGGAKQKTVALIDATGQLERPLASALDDKLPDGSPAWKIESVRLGGRSIEEARKSLQARVWQGDLYGILTVGADIDAKDAFQFYAKTVGDIKSIGPFQGALRRAVITLRFEKQKLAVDEDAISKLLAPVDMQTQEITREGGATKKGFLEVYFGTFAFVIVMFMTLLLYGIAMMRGILEEKSSRVMEVLLGSVSPDQLMTGKILGIGLVGLTQVAIYAATAGAVRIYLGAAATSADMKGILSIFTYGKLAYFVLFFILGYFMYVALFACIGAVCNSEQEAQNLQGPVQLVLMLPMMATIFFVGQPSSTASVVLSFIPIFTPMVMFMRILVQTPPAWEIVASIALTVVTTWLIFRASAKIFRIGILMYGKRPTIPEILRWARS
jgi:ABC-2 type transport system permease protein